MGNTIDVCLLAGIGDLIASKAMIFELADKINIKIDENCTNDRGIGYMSFLEQFSPLLFCEPKFTFKGFQKGGARSWTSFPNSPTRLPIQKQFYENIQSPVLGKYICLTTKNRGVAEKIISRETPILLEGLRKISNKVKIVLLGEKEIEQNGEVSVLKNMKIISNIYNDAKEIPNIIDLTVPKLGLTCPDLNTLQRDCACIANAVATVNIGLGGNTILSSSVGRTINIANGEVYDLNSVRKMFSVFSDHPNAPKLLEELNSLL